jgi:predicted  nucleic acid-binding Zn-ribbon protein
MADNIDISLIGARLEELLQLGRDHTNQITALAEPIAIVAHQLPALSDKVGILDKGQRRLDMQVEELTDKVKVQGAILTRLENSLERAVEHLSERLEHLERR